MIKISQHVGFYLNLIEYFAKFQERTFWHLMKHPILKCGSHNPRSVECILRNLLFEKVFLSCYEFRYGILPYAAPSTGVFGGIAR